MTMFVVLDNPLSGHHTCFDTYQDMGYKNPTG